MAGVSERGRSVGKVQTNLRGSAARTSVSKLSEKRALLLDFNWIQLHIGAGQWSCFRVRDSRFTEELFQSPLGEKMTAGHVVGPSTGMTLECFD